MGVSPLPTNSQVKSDPKGQPNFILAQKPGIEAKQNNTPPVWQERPVPSVNINIPETHQYDGYRIEKDNKIKINLYNTQTKEIGGTYYSLTENPIIGLNKGGVPSVVIDATREDIKVYENPNNRP